LGVVACAADELPIGDVADSEERGQFCRGEYEMPSDGEEFGWQAKVFGCDGVVLRNRVGPAGSVFAVERDLV
jgi:hypothetical protein